MKLFAKLTFVGLKGIREHHTQGIFDANIDGSCHFEVQFYGPTTPLDPRALVVSLHLQLMGGFLRKVFCC